MPHDSLPLTDPTEGMIHPESVYGDFGTIMRLYEALAIRITRNLDIELLVKVDEEDEEAAGDYGWYEVSDLRVPTTKPKLRPVN